MVLLYTRMKQLKALNKQRLVSICRKKRWRGYSRFKKEDLVTFVCCKFGIQNQAARLIQCWYAKRHQAATPYVVVNDTDFISLEKIDCIVIFRLRNHVTKQEFHFDPRNLLRFVLETGKFINPFTREPISDNDLTRLLACYLSMHEETVMTVRLGPTTLAITADTNLVNLKAFIIKRRREETEREQDVIHFDTQLVEISQIMLTMILCVPSAEVEIVTQVLDVVLNYHLPNYVFTCDYLRQLNENAARLRMSSFIGQLLVVSRDGCHSTLIRSIADSVAKIFRTHYYQLFGSLFRTVE